MEDLQSPQLRGPFSGHAVLCAGADATHSHGHSHGRQQDKAPFSNTRTTKINSALQAGGGKMPQ